MISFAATSGKQSFRDNPVPKLELGNEGNETLEATVVAQQKGFESQQKQSQAIAARQQNEIAALTAAFKAQAVQIQKVSDQLGTQSLAPRVVANN